MTKKYDFVLPWVDGNDPEWQAKKQCYDPNLNPQDHNASARYRDMGTLKYVLRSIDTNCPWYNKIYLITEGHKPTWLNIHHPKIELITHDKLFLEPKNLPVFNSNAIEMNLVNIPNLSEHFIYLNDDSLIMQETSIDRFFKNDLPVDFLCHGWVPRNKLFSLIKPIDTWIHSINNNLRLLNKSCPPKNFSHDELFHSSYSLKNKLSNLINIKFLKHYYWLEHWHHPQAYLKQTIKDVYQQFAPQMAQTARHKFRNEHDISPYLYRYWQLTNHKFTPYKYNDAVIANIESLQALENLIKEIESNGNYRFACFNDSPNLNDDNYQVVKEFLISYLEQKLPTAACFEYS